MLALATVCTFATGYINGDYILEFKVTIPSEKKLSTGTFTFIVVVVFFVVVFAAFVCRFCSFITVLLFLCCSVAVVFFCCWCFIVVLLLLFLLCCYCFLHSTYFSCYFFRSYPL